MLKEEIIKKEEESKNLGTPTKHTIRNLFLEGLDIVFLRAKSMLLFAGTLMLFTLIFGAPLSVAFALLLTIFKNYPTVTLLVEAGAMLTLFFVHFVAFCITTALTTRYWLMNLVEILQRASKFDYGLVRPLAKAAELVIQVHDEEVEKQLNELMAEEAEDESMAEEAEDESMAEEEVEELEKPQEIDSEL